MLTTKPGLRIWNGIDDMTLIKFIDSAWPPRTLDGCQGLAFYAGGDTPHVWSKAEVFSLGAEYLIPVYVRSNPAKVNPLVDAGEFIAVLRHVYGAPPGVLVALDTETAADPGYVVPFVKAVNAGGYPVIDYGSVSKVFGNANPDGYYWGADWTGVPHIFPGSQATQYVSFPQFDLSEFQSSLPLWNTKVPLSIPAKDVGMIIVKNSGRTYLLNGSTLHHVVSVADEAALSTVLPVVAISDAQLAEFEGQL